MKKYEVLARISSIISIIVGLVNIALLAGLIEIPKNIRFLVVYPLLLILLADSVVFWIIAERIRKKGNKKKE